jgi:hypothetical protein
MATEVLVNSVQSTSSDTIEKFYDSPSGGAGTIISAFTATNNTGANRSYKAYIFDASGSLLEAVVPLKIIIRKKFDLGASIVGHLIPPAGSLRMESDLADTIAFRVTGREL